MSYTKTNIYIWLFLLFSCNNNPSKHLFSTQKIKKWDSLVNVYKNKNLKERVVFFDTFQQKNIEKVPLYLQWKIYHQKGLEQLQSKKFKKAELSTKKAIIIAKHLKKYKELIKSKINLSIIYIYLNKREAAAHVLFEALKIAKQKKYPTLIDGINVSLSHIYKLSGDTKKALEILKEVAKNQEKYKDSVALAATYQNIASLYKQLGNFNTAYNYYKKGLDIKLKTHDDAYLSNFYSNLASIAYFVKKPLDTVFDYLNKAKKSSLGSPSSDIYRQIGFIYMEKNLMDSAKYYYQKSLAVCKNKPDSIKTFSAFLMLSTETGNKDAIKWLKKKDSLALEYEKEKNKEKIELLEKNQGLNLEKINLELQNHKLEQKYKLFWFGGIILFLMLVIAILVYRNKTLKIQKEKVNLEKKFLRQQLKPHFIFNSLAALQKALIYDSPVKAVSYLANFGNLMRKNFEFVNKGSIPLKQEIELLNDYIQLQQIKQEKKIDFQVITSDEIDCSKVLIPPLLLQPFVENSIEHGFSDIDCKGKITINIHKKARLLCFEIIDNGKGYNHRKNIKDNKEHALDIIKKRLKIFNGNKKYIFNISKINPGTKVYFCLRYKIINYESHNS